MKLYNMEIDCVTSGQEAIDIIRAEKVKYNAIFMDHMMPGMDGIEAVKIIRNDIGSEYAQTVPIIALTANAIVGTEEMFLQNGFQAFLSKPIEMTRLDAVIREWVRDKKIEQASGFQQANADEEMPTDIHKGRDSLDHVSAGSIAGLDMEKGLERFSGDDEAYKHVLRSYAANTRPLLKKMMGVNKDNLADYAITVHGIKGASWGICAETVGNNAQALEKAAKEGNIDFILSNNAAFIETVEKLSSDIEGMLKMLENFKPKKDKPDRETLSKLLAACEAYDMDGVDAAMADIESCYYESDNGLAIWLRDNVDKMNFAHIKEKLTNLVV